MAVDLSDLIDPLKREVNAPGTDQFAGAVDDDWVGQLEDSFWEARLYGFFTAYTDADGLVTPIKVGDPDMPRDQQQLIVLFAGLRVIRNELKNINTAFKATAGPVSFEVQQSASLLVAVLKQIQDKINLILVYLSNITSSQTTYIDSLVGRDDAIYYQDIYFQRG